MLILSIGRVIVEIIIHQLLLDYDQDDAGDEIITTGSAEDIFY